MNNAINTLRIQNFKSIKDVTIEPRRVNLIIGTPNVGKSNVLEAISLLGGMFFEANRFMDGQIRYESIRNLFYDNDWLREISVVGEGIGATRIRKRLEQAEVVFGDGSPHRKLPQLGDAFGLAGVGYAAQQAIAAMAQAGKVPTEQLEDDNPLVNFGAKNHLHELVDKNGFTSGHEISSPQPVIRVKQYGFRKHSAQDKSYNQQFLRPPFGDNLAEVIHNSSAAFRKEIAGFFTDFGLNLALRTEDRQFEIQKNVDGFVTSIPYSLIADTLQRIIFYLAAIDSNDDSVLLFEEPEAHTFPVYTTMLGQKIAESSSNQFFVATHSPYLLTEIIESLVKQEREQELGIFLAYYEDFQTKIYQLTDEEVLEIRRDAIDVFYNLNRYTPRPNPYA